MINKDARAADGAARLYVTRAIANKKASSAIDSEPARRSEQHARFRLPARALVGLAMIARFHGVDRQRSSQMTVHFLDHTNIDKAITHIRLIGDDNQAESSGFHPKQTLGRLIIQTKIGQAPGRE
jgi:hypothetical protein